MPTTAAIFVSACKPNFKSTVAYHRIFYQIYRIMSRRVHSGFFDFVDFLSFWVTFDSAFKSGKNANNTVRSTKVPGQMSTSDSPCNTKFLKYLNAEENFEKQRATIDLILAYECVRVTYKEMRRTLHTILRFSMFKIKLLNCKN